MKLKTILNSKSKTITSAAFLLAVAALASRLLGLFRDRLLAGKFGAGDELDIYFAAFRIPDMLYTILILGALSATFIPVFTSYFQRSKKEAWDLVNGLLNLGLLVLIIAAGILIVFAPYIISLVAPGFDEEKRQIAIFMTRIMFLSPVLLGVSNIFSGVLQTFGRFFVYSLTPIMYNLGIIGGIVFFVPVFGLSGLAWGVILGAFLHMMIQIPSLRFLGFRFKRILTIAHKGIREIGKLMVPRTIGLAAFQINLVVITAIASTLASGSIAIFNLANNLQHVPVGIFGIAFATAVFPKLARAFSKKNREAFRQSFSSAFRQILFLVIPLSALFFLLRAQIVRVVLGTGKFGWVDTRLTAAALALFSFGIFAHSLIPLVARAFYALHNTKIPVIVSLVSMGVNIVASFSFVALLKFPNIFTAFIFQFLKLEGIGEIAILGLPLAFSLAGIINFLILLFVLSSKAGDWDRKKISCSFLKILLATFIMGLVAYGLLYFLNIFLDTHRFLGIFLQGLGAGIGGLLIYWLVTFLLASPELSVLQRSLGGFIFRTKIKSPEVHPEEGI